MWLPAISPFFYSYCLNYRKVNLFIKEKQWSILDSPRGRIFWYFFFFFCCCNCWEKNEWLVQTLPIIDRIPAMWSSVLLFLLLSLTHSWVPSRSAWDTPGTLQVRADTRTNRALSLNQTPLLPPLQVRADTLTNRALSLNQIPLLPPLYQFSNHGISFESYQLYLTRNLSLKNCHWLLIDGDTS